MSANIPDNIEDLEKLPRSAANEQALEPDVWLYPYREKDGTAHYLSTPNGYKLDVAFHKQGYMPLRTNGIHTPYGGNIPELFAQTTTQKVLDVRLTALHVNIDELPLSEQDRLNRLLDQEEESLESHPNRSQAEQNLFRHEALLSVRKTLSFVAMCDNFTYTSAFHHLDRARFLLHLNSYILYEDDLLSARYSPERVGKGIFLGDASPQQLGQLAVRFSWGENDGGEIRKFGTLNSPDGYLVPAI